MLGAGLPTTWNQVRNGPRFTRLWVHTGPELIWDQVYRTPEVGRFSFDVRLAASVCFLFREPRCIRYPVPGSCVYAEPVYTGVPSIPENYIRVPRVRVYLGRGH